MMSKTENFALIEIMSEFSKYLCIFGGGAVRGYAYLGVLRAFRELGFSPQKYAGSSVGAIFAAFCAVNMPPEEMEKTFWDVNFELFKDINFSFAPAFSISKGGVFLKWVRKHIEETFYGENYKKGENPPVCFKDLPNDLAIVTTDLLKCKPFIFSKENTPDFEVAMAVRISAAMPGLMTSVEYEDKLLADGDIMKSYPLWKMGDELCPDDMRVLELRLEGIKKEGRIKNLPEYFNIVYSCMTNSATDFIMNTYADYDKFDYIKIDTKDLVIVNFNISDETKEQLIMLGYETTINYFNEILPKKRKNILEIYEILNQESLIAEKNILKKNIKKAKFNLKKLLFILCEKGEVIDKKIYNEIKEFQKIFDKNLTKGFLGKEKLENKSLVEEKIFEIKENLKEKIKELQV